MIAEMLNDAGEPPPHAALRHVLRRHTDIPRSLAIAPDGTWFVTTSRDGTAQLWDARTGETGPHSRRTRRLG